VLARDIYRDLYEDSGPTIGEKFALAGKRLGVVLACGALGLGVLDFAGVHSIPGVSSFVQSARARLTGSSEPLPLLAQAVTSDAVRVAVPIARSKPQKKIAGSSPIDAVAAESRKDVFSMAMTSSTLAAPSFALAPARPASNASVPALASIKSDLVTTEPKQAAQASGAMQISDIAARSQASVPPDIQLASLPAQDAVQATVEDTAPGAAQETPSSSSIVATAVPLIPLKDVPLPRAAPPMSPADRLSLKGKDYSRAERCLANAIYFEARSEPIRGQMAVAQVVINRVFSGFYPNDVCGVVYQNANRHLACQFTFACDGKSKAITERSHWAVANRIARQTLDGQIYVPEVGKSTHYHAAYVHPNWAHEMRRLVRFGLHSFYRPYAWGNGSEEPVWGPSPSLVHGHKTASR
jgi:hypothetical protein